MPNGGSICCAHCANADGAMDRCCIFGTPLSPVYLCRTFRLPDQTNQEAQDCWVLLRRLEPGVVYSIDNSYPSSGTPPKPQFRVVAVKRGEE